MHEQVGAVNASGRDPTDFAPGEPDADDRAGRPSRNFTYPGGSRPLEGYTIKRGVGHGGFGEIYYAVSDAGKEVALKLIRRNLEIELRGIRHCLNLKHPNLLVLYDIRQDDTGDTWVVMEYVSGGCLSDAVAAHPNGMPTEEALIWFQGTAAGVAHLHDRGIVHRDLKPANIFCEEGLVKVGDYGLSKFISCSRRSGQTESVGTVHYMAPEVANGRYGKEIDVYALGVILYEMLTGRVPFEGESVGEVLMKHLTAQPDVSVLPEPYRSVVAKALEKDPAKRYRSVAEMAAALPPLGHTPPGADRLPLGSYAQVAGARLPQTQPIPEARLVDEEPILKAIGDAWNRLHTAWVQANLATSLKVIILVALIFALVTNAGFLVPLAVVLLITYGVYRAVRAVALSGQSRQRHGVGPGPVRQPTAPQPPTPQPAPPGPAAARPAPVHARTRPGQHRWPHHREKAAEALVLKSPRERLTDLIGSLLASALVALAMCVVMILLNGLVVEDSSQVADYQRWSQYGWLALMAVTATWAVLIPAKFWEGTRGEAAVRRFTMMVIGLALGVAAFGVAEMLRVDLSVGPDYGIETIGDPSPALYSSYGQPNVKAMMACFGVLFLLMRWWRQADPLRATRLSLWAVFVSVVAAGLVTAVLSFQQASWLIMLAAVMSVSIQLASPWIHPRDRARRKAA